MSRISPGPLGVSCQPKKCDSYSLLCGSVTARSQDRMHLELTVLNVHVWLHSVWCQIEQISQIKPLFCILHKWHYYIMCYIIVGHVPNWWESSSSAKLMVVDEWALSGLLKAISEYWLVVWFGLSEIPFLEAKRSPKSVRGNQATVWLQEHPSIVSVQR